MKQWDRQIDAGPKYGVCTVREHTDDEVNQAREKGILLAHCDGFVNLSFMVKSSSHGVEFVGLKAD